MEWYKNLGYDKNFVSKAIAIANELSNFPTLGNIGTEALYLIATHDLDYLTIAKIP